MKVVLDVNVIVAAMLSRHGAPAALIQEWQKGAFELTVSPLLLAELRRVLEYPKISQRISSDDTEAALRLIAASGVMLPNPVGPSAVVSRDRNDNYLIVLAESARGPIVSGDKDLLSLAGLVRVYSPAEFLSLLRSIKPD